MKIYIVYNNDDYYVKTVIAVTDDEEKAKEIKKIIQPHVVQEITIDDYPLNVIREHYQKKVKK